MLLLEKSVFPRDKVCGDGLTPRGVKQVLALGVDVSGDDWLRNKGLRVVGGGTSLELDWPVLQDYPDFGLVRPRRDFDQMLADMAVKAGARLHLAVTVTGPDPGRENRSDPGVQAKTDGGPVSFHAPLVIAADGVSARIALGMGINKRDDRPLGVAVRRYYNSPAKTHDDYLESHLELWDRSNADASRSCCPGYGWIFGLGDGTVNVGLGHAQFLEGLRQDRLSKVAARPGWTAPPRSGVSGRRTPSAASAAPGCRWDSTEPRTTATVWCCSVMRAAR